MISRKIKTLSVAVVAAALITTPALARTVSKTTASANHGYSANTVVGIDGKVLGADPDANIRFQLLREGPFDAS